MKDDYNAIVDDPEARLPWRLSDDDDPADLEECPGCGAGPGVDHARGCEAAEQPDEESAALAHGERQWELETNR